MICTGKVANRLETIACSGKSKDTEDDKMKRIGTTSWAISSLTNRASSSSQSRVEREHSVMAVRAVSSIESARNVSTSGRSKVASSNKLARQKQAPKRPNATAG